MGKRKLTTNEPLPNEASAFPLDWVRRRPCCELCGQPTLGGCQAHHVLGRGLEGVNRLDHLWNLMGLCRDCHAAIHTEGTRGLMQRLLARLRHTTVERIRDKIREGPC